MVNTAKLFQEIKGMDTDIKVAFLIFFLNKKKEVALIV